MFRSQYRLFKDRRDAGWQLARALMQYRAARPVVLALPRGGVPIAHEVARALEAPIDLVLVRKLPAPGFAELALGAVVDGAEPRVVLNEQVAAQLTIPAGYLEREREIALVEIERRRRLYLGDRRPIPLRGRTAIVVDDGIATGATVKVALEALAASRPARLVLAVPVAPSDTISELQALADDVVCLATPDPFYAVGLHYADFSQTSDDEVIALLAAEPASAERRTA